MMGRFGKEQATGIINGLICQESPVGVAFFGLGGNYITFLLVFSWQLRTGLQFFRRVKEGMDR